MDLGNIVCGRREAGPDGPYRLVGDDEAGGACAVRQRAVELPIAYRKGASGLALRAGLANAHDRDEAGSPGCLRLGADRRVVFAMILPPLRVADDHRRRAGVGQHFGGQLARKGAGRLGPAILAADQKLRAARARRKAHQQGRRRADHEVDLRGQRCCALNHAVELGGGAAQSVHFPIARHKRAARRRHGWSLSGYSPVIERLAEQPPRRKSRTSPRCSAPSPSL